MDPTWERRPTNETTPAPTKKLSTESISLEDRHAAWLSGVDHGRAERVEMAIEDRVLAILHEQTRGALGMAKRYAAAKGPAWEAMIVWSGERE